MIEIKCTEKEKEDICNALIRSGACYLANSEHCNDDCCLCVEKEIKWDIQPEPLKPCPCCGGKAKNVYTKDFNYVFCTECELTTTTYETEKEAADVWNRRCGNRKEEEI